MKEFTLTWDDEKLKDKQEFFKKDKVNDISRWSFAKFLFNPRDIVYITLESLNVIAMKNQISDGKLQM